MGEKRDIGPDDFQASIMSGLVQAAIPFDMRVEAGKPVFVYEDGTQRGPGDKWDFNQDHGRITEIKAVISLKLVKPYPSRQRAEEYARHGGDLERLYDSPLDPEWLGKEFKGPDGKTWRVVGMNSRRSRPVLCEDVETGSLIYLPDLTVTQACEEDVEWPNNLTGLTLADAWDPEPVTKP